MFPQPQHPELEWRPHLNLLLLRPRRGDPSVLPVPDTARVAERLKSDIGNPQINQAESFIQEQNQIGEYLGTGRAGSPERGSGGPANRAALRRAITATWIGRSRRLQTEPKQETYESPEHESIDAKTQTSEEAQGSIPSRNWDHPSFRSNIQVASSLRSAAAVAATALGLLRSPPSISDRCKRGKKGCSSEFLEWISREGGGKNGGKEKTVEGTMRRKAAFIVVNWFRLTNKLAVNRVDFVMACIRCVGGKACAARYRGGVQEQHYLNPRAGVFYRIDLYGENSRGCEVLCPTAACLSWMTWRASAPKKWGRSVQGFRVVGGAVVEVVCCLTFSSGSCTAATPRLPSGGSERASGGGRRKP